MKIKVIKTTQASEDPSGCKAVEYTKGKVYDIYQELAEVFINQEWGKEEIETQNLEEVFTNQEFEAEIETKDFPKKQKKNVVN
jgi:hypothetical protein